MPGKYFQKVLRGTHEMIYTLLALPRAWRFMWRHRLWEGLRDYGWVARGLVTMAVLVGLYMIAEVVDFVSSHADAPIQSLFMSTESVFLQFVFDAYESLSDGALKWVILILLEVIIYHFMRRSLAIIIDRDIEDAHNFKPFLRAQRRMIVVSIFSALTESVLLNIGEGIVPGFLWWPLGIALSATFLGFAIADNYNEQFELSIKQSWRHLYRHHIGICLGLGLPLLLLLKIPFLGAVVGPLLASVTAAIVLRELSDLHLVGYRMSEEEQAKADKKAAKKAAKQARKEAKRTKQLA